MTDADVHRLLAEKQIQKVARTSTSSMPSATSGIRASTKALHVDVEEVREALEHVSAIVEAIADDL